MTGSISEEGRPSSRSSQRGLAARAALVLGIALLAALLAGILRFAGNGVLLVFAASILGVVLDGLTALVCRYTRLPRALGLTVTVVVIAIALDALLWTAGARMATQAPALRDSLQQSISDLEGRLTQAGISPALLAASTAGVSPTQGALARLLTLEAPVAGTLRVLGDLVLIVVAGIYFAAQPKVYTDTIVKLLPIGRRDRLRDVMGVVANALRRWMAGRVVAMLAVGGMTAIGMLLLNVRLALSLGFIAGMLTFVPYLGVVISLIPAVLVALLTGPTAALYVVLLFFGAYLLEGYLLTPLIQKEAVQMAPGWLIVVQVFGYLLAGVFGMAMATPAAVAIAIVVQMLYVHDVLGDHVHLLGEP